MSDPVGTQIVGFLTNRLICLPSNSSPQQETMQETDVQCHGLLKHCIYIVFEVFRVNIQRLSVSDTNDSSRFSFSLAAKTINFHAINVE